MQTAQLQDELWREPQEIPGETVFFNEHGRSLQTGRYMVNYRSWYFKVVGSEYSNLCLLVKHGGGQERMQIYAAKEEWLAMLGALDSDTRFRILFTLYKSIHEAAASAQIQESIKYETAFVNGKLHKRKQRGTNNYKVWIGEK